MNICGVLVHANPDRVAEVTAALARLPGVDLHGAAEAGRIIVTVEDTAMGAASDGLAQIHALPGVVSAALVYHHFEPDGIESGAVAKEA
jgi:periplasmic nitrate reductase NapD